MKTLIYAICGLLAVAAMVVLAPPARAQTAADVNRLNAAIQICNSPMGAGTPECARLRGQLGGGGAASGAAGLLGSVMNASRTPPAAPALGPVAGVDTKAAIQQSIATCVRNAGADTAAIQACLAIATGGAPAAPR